MRDDYGKLWFNIIDYTGSATRLFADPAFDGDPAPVTEEEIDEDGEVKAVTESMTPGSDDRRRDRSRDHRAADGRTAQVLLRRRPGRDRRAPRLRARPGRQAAPRGAVHRLRRREGALALPDRAGAARAVGRPGEAVRDHRDAGGARHRLRASWPRPPASPRPTRSICCAIWPSTRRCAPGASGRRRCARPARTSSTATAPRRARCWRNCWRNTPSMATPSSCCPTCCRSRQSPSMAPSARSSSCSAAPEKLRAAVTELQTLALCRLRQKDANAVPATTAQSLGSLLKSARDIMRKDKGLERRPRPAAAPHVDHVPEVPR